jgi:hypothetical protein
MVWCVCGEGRCCLTSGIRKVRVKETRLGASGNIVQGTKSQPVPEGKWNRGLTSTWLACAAKRPRRAEPTVLPRRLEALWSRITGPPPLQASRRGEFCHTLVRRLRVYLPLVFALRRHTPAGRGRRAGARWSPPCG